MHLYTACMSSILNKSSGLQHVGHSNVVKMSNGIMLNFYLRLPHVLLTNFQLDSMYFKVYMYKFSAQKQVVTPKLDLPSITSFE